MSTVEHTASSTNGRVPLPRRIAELMAEKGEAYSIRAFAAKIGISRELLRLILVGERPVTPSTVEKIAQGLGVTVERLKQSDTEKWELELQGISQAKKKTKTMLLRALELSKEIVTVAKGATERAYGLTMLGRVQFDLQQYDGAHETLQAAFEHAQKLHTTFGDSTLLHFVSSYLMMSYTIRKEYTNILQTLRIVEEVFADDPEKLGIAHYSRMKWYEHRGEPDKALQQSYLAFEHFEQTGKEDQMGKALINIAHFEFTSGNYEKSRNALVSALTYLRLTEHDHSYMIAVKEYVKTLLQLHEHHEAYRTIEAHTEKASEFPELFGKLMILNTIAKDDPSYAASVSANSELSLEVRNLACKQLMKHYSSKDDSESVMHYYKLGQMLTTKRNKQFNEEAF